MQNSLHSLKQQLSSINKSMEGGKITCSQDVMDFLKKVSESQLKIEGMLGDMQQKYEEKRQQVADLQSAVLNMEKNAQAKVRQRSNIENITIFVITWWWVYLIVQKYVFPYFY